MTRSQNLLRQIASQRRQLDFTRSLITSLERKLSCTHKHPDGSSAAKSNYAWVDTCTICEDEIEEATDYV